MNFFENRSLVQSPVSVARYLFREFVGKPATFTPNTFGQFVDTHGPLSNVEGAEEALTQDAIDNGRMGIFVPQTYSSCGQVIGSTTLFKRLILNPNPGNTAPKYIPQVKKDHSF